MMSDDDALGWAIRVADPDFVDWDGFTAWLEADPAHAARYDAISAALADAAAHVAAASLEPGTSGDALVPDLVALATSAPVTVITRHPSRRRHSGWAGAAIAAALIGAVGLGVWQDRAQPYAVETAAGEQRTIPLVDGSRIILSGGSRLRLDRAEPRFAALDRGEALFQVRHDAAHPFTVSAGPVELTDLGTVFDVSRNGDRARVAVAEGAVMVDPDGAALRLDPGQAAVATGTRLERRPVDPEDVGGWRAGRLAFDDAALEEVAADLSRHLDRRITASPAIARRSFRGTLDARSLRDDPALLGALLDVRVRRTADGWLLESLR